VPGYGRGGEGRSQRSQCRWWRRPWTKCAGTAAQAGAEQTAAAGAMPIQAEISAGGDDGGGAVPVCTLDGDGTTLGQTGRSALRSTLRISCGHALLPSEEWWAYGGPARSGM